jgi:predicted nucleic acid-binding protein
MEKVVLDTDVLVDLLRGKEKAVRKIQELEEHAIIYTTVVNLFELYYGAYKSKYKEKNVKAVSELEKSINILLLDERSAEIAGKMLAELQSKGKDVEFRDALIAGIAIRNSVPIYTRNVKHFRRFPVKLLED